MKILVTGSEGNIGRKLVSYLSSVGHTVFGVDIVQRHAPLYQTVDICDGAEMSNIMQAFEPDVVIHLAAMVSRVTCERSPNTTIHTNIYGTQVIIRLCKLFRARLLFFSTSEVYGNQDGVLKENGVLQPNNFYGLSKKMGEELVQYGMLGGLNAIIVRPFMIYDEDETRGEHRSAMIRFADDLSHGKKIIVHKDAYRSWMHISDAVAVIENLCFATEYPIINIGNPNVYSMIYLAHLICCELDIPYVECVEEEALPSKMTLVKYPDLRRQMVVTKGYECQVSIEEGVKRVLSKINK